MRLLLIATLGDTLRAFYLPIANHFRKAGWRVDGLGSGISDLAKCRAAFDHVYDVPFSRNPFDRHNLTASPRAIAAIVEANSYELVHVSTPVAAFITRFALRRQRLRGRPKVIYTAHGFHFHQGGGALTNAVFVAAERMAGKWTDYLTVMNPEDRLMAERYRLVPPGRLAYIPGVGIDLNEFSPEAVPDAAVAEVRRELRLNADQPLLLMIADFSRRKRHGDALAAFARLNHPTARLAFAGCGALMEPMKAVAARLGIADRVAFLGTRRDVRVLARAAVATVLPSAREGLPRSVMEALSLSVPVIGSDIRGTRELLAGGCGILVKLGDINGLANAMEWVLAHPGQARAMGMLGRAQMREYDVSNIIHRHESLYLAALSGSSTQTAAEVLACSQTPASGEGAA